MFSVAPLTKPRSKRAAQRATPRPLPNCIPLLQHRNVVLTMNLQLSNMNQTTFVPTVLDIALAMDGQAEATSRPSCWRRNGAISARFVSRSSELTQDHGGRSKLPQLAMHWRSAAPKGSLLLVE